MLVLHSLWIDNFIRFSRLGLLAEAIAQGGEKHNSFLSEALRLGSQFT